MNDIYYISSIFIMCICIFIKNVVLNNNLMQSNFCYNIQDGGGYAASLRTTAYEYGTNIYPSALQNLF